MKDLTPGWYPGMPLDPRRERRLIRVEAHRDDCARNYNDHITDRKGRRLQRYAADPEKERKSSRTRYGRNREQILADKRRKYQEKKGSPVRKYERGEKL